MHDGCEMKKGLPGRTIQGLCEKKVLGRPQAPQSSPFVLK
jgi:hypothetical protein